MTSSQAIAKAKADGFTEVLAMSDRASWRCIPNFVRYGPMQATGRYKGYLKPLFQLATNDPTVHTPGIGGPIFIVLPTAADAARCVSSLIGELEHPPLSASNRPYKVIDPATIVVAPHPVNSPTSTDPKATGDYQIFLSRGRVLALGETDTQPDAATVESDMAKLASQISGS